MCKSRFDERFLVLIVIIQAFDRSKHHLCIIHDMMKVLFYFLFSIQHLQDILDLDLSALQWIMKCFPEEKEIETMRKYVGRYGLTGKQQVSKLVVEKVWECESITFKNFPMIV